VKTGLKGPIFIGPENITVGVQNRSKMNCQSIARSTVNGRIFDRWGCRSTASRHSENFLTIGRPLGRPRPEPESCISGRSTGQLTGAISKESTARSTLKPCTSVHIDRPVDRPSQASVNRSVDR